MKIEAKQENGDEIDSSVTWIKHNEDLLVKGVTIQQKDITVKMMPNGSTENIMTSQIYEQWVHSQRIDKYEDRTVYDVVGIIGEAGEISSALKKLFRGQTTPEEFKEEVLLECGDTLHYLVRLLDDVGFTLTECMEANREKMANRVKYGKNNYGTRS